MKLYATGPFDRIGTVAPAQLVQCQVEMHHLRSIFEEVQLLNTPDQSGKTDPHQANQHATLIKTLKQLPGNGYQCMIKRGIGNPFLQGVGIKI